MIHLDLTIVAILTWILADFLLFQETDLSTFYEP